MKEKMIVIEGTYRPMNDSSRYDVCDVWYLMAPLQYDRYKHQHDRKNSFLQTYLASYIVRKDDLCLIKHRHCITKLVAVYDVETLKKLANKNLSEVEILVVHTEANNFETLSYIEIKFPHITILTQEK